MLRMPKEITLTDQEGNTRTFNIHKFSAYDGREIVTQYPMSGMPKIGEYKTNEALSLKMMAYVTIDMGEDKQLPLTTKILVENHCVDWEVLAKLEMELMRYNCSFFAEGKVSNLLNDLTTKGTGWISQMLTDLLEQLSEQNKRPSKN